MVLPLLALQSPPPKVEMPKSLRGSSYLGKIDRLARAAGLPDLRRTQLGGTDFELRVWVYLEIAANPLHGRILRRRAMRYSGFQLSQPSDPRILLRPVPLRVPKSGWPALWRGLAPLLTLRDESALPPDDIWVTDGETVIVEIALPGRYRAFLHSNPEYHKSRKDAMTLVRMVRLLDREFATR